MLGSLSSNPPNIARLSGPGLPGRGFRAWWRAALAAVLALAAAPASAAPVKDAAAETALKEAMDSDYFETRFDKAEAKLRAAIDACGTGCSVEMKAKLYAALGTVLAGGKKQLGDGQEAFVDALKLDPKVAPDPDLASTEVQFAFEKAKAELKVGAAAGAAAAIHKPPAAQRVRTPVPIYLEIAPDALLLVRKVTGSFAGTGTETFVPLAFRKIGERGYGAELPCDEVVKEGEARYFITVLGENDKVIATFGSRAEPLRVPIRTTITSEAPRWPGFTAPEQCSSRMDTTQCLGDEQCSTGLVCEAGQCVVDTKKAAPSSTKLKNWFTLTFAPDFGLFSAQNVCTATGQNEDKYVCQREDGSRYVGTPTLNVANNVNFGFVVGTLRVALQYDRVVWDNVTAGLRVGFAFNGPSGDGVDFLPLHIEGRVGYSLGKDVFDKPGLRPFAFLSGGLAQVDSGVKVEVLEDGTACGAQPADDPGAPCTRPSYDGRTEPRTQKLNAYKQAGRGFAGLGIGLAYNPIRNVGIHVALRGSVTFPVVIGVISPEAGVTFGF